MSVVTTFGVNLLVPRLAYRIRWWSRLGLIGTMVFVATRVAFAVVFMRLVYDMALRRDRILDELRERLGREPTDDELTEFVVAMSERA